MKRPKQVFGIWCCAAAMRCDRLHTASCGMYCSKPSEDWKQNLISAATERDDWKKLIKKWKKKTSHFRTHRYQNFTVANGEISQRAEGLCHALYSSREEKSVPAFKFLWKQRSPFSANPSLLSLYSTLCITVTPPPPCQTACRHTAGHSFYIY